MKVIKGRYARRGGKNFAIIAETAHDVCVLAMFTFAHGTTENGRRKQNLKLWWDRNRCTIMQMTSKRERR